MNFRRRSILPMRSSFLRYQISKTPRSRGRLDHERPTFGCRFLAKYKRSCSILSLDTTTPLQVVRVRTSLSAAVSSLQGH
jgi:hypothetical protein